MNNVWILVLCIVLEFEFFRWLPFLCVLFFNFLVLDQVDIVLFKTLRGIERNFSMAADGVLSRVVFLVLNCGNLMMFDQLRVLFFWNSEIMIIQSSLVSNLLWNELRMVSSRDTLVDEFLLVWGNHQVCVYELSHFYVVSEYIERQRLTFGNSNEFIFWVVFFVRSINHCHFVISVCTIFESGYWGKNLSKNLILRGLLVSETTLLPVEKFPHCKSVRHRSILRQLME